MSKIDEVRAEMMKAMKNGDKQRKDVLSLLLSALKAKFIDKRADLTEAEENEVIQKEIKQTRETMETSPKDREDIVRQCEYTLSVLEEYAPKMMTEEEIRKTIASVLEQLGIGEPQAQDKGCVMKTLMPLVKGKADGGLVNKMVSEICK